MKKSLSVVALTTLAAAMAQAQTPNLESQAKLNAMVVTAARGPQMLNDSLADLSVIEREEIEQSGAASLVEILQRQAGVEISTNGGPGSTSAVFLRGSNPSHTVILVDGLRVGSSTAGSATLEALPLAMIDHVEILRGPASSLYGADAIGGVIQIFTRQGEGARRLDASLGMGSYRSLRGNGGISASEGAWRYALQAGYAQSDGFSAIWNPAHYSYNPDRDGYRQSNMSLQLAFKPASGHELSAQAWESRLNAQFDGSADFDDRTRTTVRGTALAYRANPGTVWNLFLRAGQTLDDSESSSAWGTFRARTTQNLYTAQNDFKLPLGSLQLALERREEHITADTDYAVQQRNTNSIVGLYQLSVDAHSVQGNLRHDANSQYGDKTTGGLAYGYRLSPALRASLSLGTAFKAPSFNDLYYPGFGNPQLKPETSRNVEAMLKYATGGLELKAVAYRNRVEDLIVFQCDANYNCAPYNVDDARLTGLSLSGSWKLDDLSLSAQLDLARPENASTGLLLPRRAKEHGGISAEQRFGSWKFGAEWQASSRRYEDAANERAMGGFGLLNFSARHEFAGGWSVLARINNVLDKHYEFARDYATPGVNAFLALQYRS